MLSSILEWLWNNPDTLETIIFAMMIFAIVGIAALADKRGWKNYWDNSDR